MAFLVLQRTGDPQTERLFADELILQLHEMGHKGMFLTMAGRVSLRAAAHLSIDYPLAVLLGNFDFSD